MKVLHLILIKNTVNALLVKIALIGFGNIGCQIAVLLKDGNHDVVVFDLKKEISQGKILDIKHSPNIKSNIYFSENYEDLRDSDFIVITAGLPRQKKQTRADLLDINRPIIHSIAQQVAKYSPNSFVIIVTNPIDEILFEFIKESKMNSNQCIGMSSSLDTERFKHILADYFNITTDFVETIVMGMHNEKMFFVKEETKNQWRFC